MKKLVQLLTILAASLTFTLASSDAADTILTEYYWILKPGYRAEFTQNVEFKIKEDTFPPHINKSVKFFGKFLNGDFKNAQIFDYDGSGNLLWYGSTYESGWFQIIEPAAMLFPSVLEIGKTYKYSITSAEYTSDGGDYHGEGHEDTQIMVTGPFTISVPAGTFTVYKMTMVDKWSDSWGNSGEDTSIYWLAKNIGTVKYSYNSFVIELIDSTTLNQPLGECLEFNSDFSIDFACLDLGGFELSLTADYTGNGLIWEFDLDTLTVGDNQDGCLVFNEDFSIDVTCIDLGGFKFSFVLKYTGTGLQWEIDPASLKLL